MGNNCEKEDPHVTREKAAVEMIKNLRKIHRKRDNDNDNTEESNMDGKNNAKRAKIVNEEPPPNLKPTPNLQLSDSTNITTLSCSYLEPFVKLSDPSNITIVNRSDSQLNDQPNKPHIQPSDPPNITAGDCSKVTPNHQPSKLHIQPSDPLNISMGDCSNVTPKTSKMSDFSTLTIENCSNVIPTQMELKPPKRGILPPLQRRVAQMCQSQ